MKNIEKTNLLWNTLLLHKKDLEKLFCDSRANIVNEEVVMPKYTIDGACTNVYDKQSILIQSKIDIKSTLRIHYPAEIKSDCLFLLFYRSNSSLNFRTNVDFAIDEKILNHQSKSGSVFWTSNVDIEVMIPAETTISFRFLVIRKSTLENFINSKKILNKDNLILITKSCRPIFHFSNFFYTENDSMSKSDYHFIYQENAIQELILKYLKINIELSNDYFTLWHLFTAMLIEQKICNTPATDKPNIEDLCKQLNSCEFQLLKIFKQVFGMTISKYHRHIHMEYARWLLETQQLNVREVGEQLGYSDRRAFSHIFKTHYMGNPKIFKSRTI
jgi:AraC-like DNA-binding protein